MTVIAPRSPSGPMWISNPVFRFGRNSGPPIFFARALTAPPDAGSAIQRLSPSWKSYGCFCRPHFSWHKGNHAQWPSRLIWDTTVPRAVADPVSTVPPTSPAPSVFNTFRRFIFSGSFIGLFRSLNIVRWLSFRTRLITPHSIITSCQMLTCVNSINIYYIITDTIHISAKEIERRML